MGPRLHAPTSLRSKLSFYKKLVKFSDGQLKANYALMEDDLSKWDKEHELKQANAFSSSELFEVFFLNMNLSTCF